MFAGLCSSSLYFAGTLLPAEGPWRAVGVYSASPDCVCMHVRRYKLWYHGITNIKRYIMLSVAVGCSGHGWAYVAPVCLPFPQVLVLCPAVLSWPDPDLDTLMMCFPLMIFHFCPFCLLHICVNKNTFTEIKQNKTQKSVVSPIYWNIGTVLGPTCQRPRQRRQMVWKSRKIHHISIF